VVREEGASGREDDNEAEEEEGSRTAGFVALVALLGAAVFTYLMVFQGDRYQVTAEFANAGQLVKGNEVVVGGSKVGSVDAVELGPQNEALVTFTIDDRYAPLRRGTVATIRSPSLSQIAGRQVELTLPAEQSAGEEIADGGALSQAETVSAVDLDQLFNTLSPKTIKDFKHVIQGLELSYEGVGPQANRGLKYLNPFLSTSRRLFSELNSGQTAFENLIVDSSRLSGALAARAPEISALIGNLNRMMGAIGERKERLALAISELPDFMRNANTTFVNLRAALSDVDPLVDASKPVAAELRPFLAELRAAAADAVPTVTDLDAIISKGGEANDLVELTALQPRLAAAGVGSGSPECGPGPAEPDDLKVAADDDFDQGAFGEAVCSLDNGELNLAFFRAYTPELVGWFDGFGHSGYVDAISGIGRVSTSFNAFSLNGPGGTPDLTSPLTPAEIEAAMDTGNVARCPGGNEHPVTDVDPSDTSVPFTDGGALSDGEPGHCEPDQTAPGS
jgi:phospholipid/cholesterol/gamma-HCH transport system substrate-binding protein